ncbi:MAG: element excision factor XisH family protein [Nostoc sp.]|uniref:element excision factor XisH family protein n=1 Tax=Nostoc sp. TaxID=1180 RepID=UPI002FF7F162
MTDDPLHLKWGQKDMYVDLGVKQLLAAEQGTKKIAVEKLSYIFTSKGKITVKVEPMPTSETRLI